jgi:Arc/MetJ-type ribon-helix-helix transcriptional regulator
MAKVRRFDTGVAGQVTPEPAAAPVRENLVPDIPSEAADRVAASAPVRIMPPQPRERGNPRRRRYKQKTYSLLQEDIDLIEALVAEIRRSGLYDRGRSDVVRAGVRLLSTLPTAEKLKAIQAVESLKG